MVDCRRKPAAWATAVPAYRTNPDGPPGVTNAVSEECDAPTAQRQVLQTGTPFSRDPAGTSTYQHYAGQLVS
jgi:hypothetical protein